MVTIPLGNLVQASFRDAIPTHQKTTPARALRASLRAALWRPVAHPVLLFTSSKQTKLAAFSSYSYIYLPETALSLWIHFLIGWN